MHTRNVCKNCGGALERKGMFDICPYCDSKWAIATEDSVQIRLQNAYDALRQIDFDKSMELFEDIILSNPKNYEAHWGKALAKNGIIFVNDLNENKKVPTFNNISENSFLNDKCVKDAIALAPAEISESYKKHAEKIEKIRIEWLEKVKKEKPYDIFICFKDSDKENGIERTTDSYAAQELYTELSKEGYNVFFSRVSLRDKISEQYEPYIYNALNTAKVMIVYGERAEYFNSAWVKNEWNRFKKRIESGEKQKNSLIVAYKNLDVYDLPAALKVRQCMNSADMTFYMDLSNHIKKVIELSNQNIHVERIKVEGGKISKKASQITTNTVKTREIGESASTQTDINEQQSINLIHTYLNMKNWSEASSLVENVLFENPTCAEAIWCKILINNRVSDDKSLCEKLRDKKGFDDAALLEKVINCASKEHASRILNLLYDINYQYDKMHAFMLKCILPYLYPERDNKIEISFIKARDYLKVETFETLLTTIDSKDVDSYIHHNLVFATAMSKSNISSSKKYINNVLSVDEGNIDALRLIVRNQIYGEADAIEMTSSFEALLKYATNVDEEVMQAAMNLESRALPLQKNHIIFMKQLLKYYRGNLSDLKNILLDFANKILSTQYKKEAEYYYNLVISLDKNCADAYWGLCLMRIGASNELDIPNCAIPIKKCPEFNKYLTLVNEQRRMGCIKLANEQPERIKSEIDLQKQESDELDSYKNSLVRKRQRLQKNIPATFSLLYIAVEIIIKAATYYMLAIHQDPASGETIISYFHEFPIITILNVLIVPCLFELIPSFLGAYIIMKKDGGSDYWGSYGANLITFGIGGLTASISCIKKFNEQSDNLLAEIRDTDNKIIKITSDIYKLQEQLKMFE